MGRPSARSARRGSVQAAAVTVGVVASSLLTWGASSAAFNAATTNGTNTFGTGTVVLSSAPGSALFTVTGLKPGATGSACITVSYAGSLAATVRLYGTAPSATNALDNYLTVQIDETTGPGGTITGPSCTGLGATTNLFSSTLNSFAISKTSHATGISSWAPSSPATKDYRFTYTLSASTPSSAQSSTAAIAFTWEAANT